MLRKTNRREAYFAALKFNFQTYLHSVPETAWTKAWRKRAYMKAQQLAAEYAFRVRSEDLASIAVWC